jgi:hypothetical protein
VFLNKKQKHSQTLIQNGHQLFIWFNTLRYDMQTVSALFQPPLFTTPSFLSVPQPVIVDSIVLNFGVIDVVLSQAMNDTSNVVCLSLSRPLLPSQTSAHQKLVLMKAATEDGENFDCADYYTEVYGRQPIAGEFLQCRLTVWDENQECFTQITNQRIEVE